MRSLVLIVIAAVASIGSAAIAGGAGGGGGGAHGGGGFHGGGGMHGGARAVAISRSHSSSNSTSSSFSHSGGWGGGWGHGGWGHGGWGGNGGHGGWHPGGGRGGWHHPGRPGNWGGHYRRPFRGWRLPGFFLGGDYFLGDWWDYGLPAPADGYNWARYYDDAVLVDGDGMVSDARYGMNWNDQDYSDGAGMGPDGVGMGPGGPPTLTGAPGGRNPFENAYSSGYDDGYQDGFGDGADSVTWGHRWNGAAIGGHGGYSAGTATSGAAHTEYFSGPGGGTTIVVHSPSMMTTTTTTSEEVSYAAPARAWHARPKPRRVWRKPACTCRCYCR